MFKPWCLRFAPLVVSATVLVAACDDGDAALASSTASLVGQPAEATTILTFTFDDGLDSQLLAAKILEGDPGTAPEDSFRGTFFVITGALRRPGDAAGRMTGADVQALAAAGHEIAGHSLNHLDLAVLAGEDPVELRRQVCNDKRALDALGTHPQGFAYPKSSDAGAHDSVRDCGYGYGRDAAGLSLPGRAGAHAETVPPLDRFAIRALPSISASAPAGDQRHESSKAVVLEDWIQSVRAAGGGWLPITIHHLRDGCGDLGYCMEERELRALVAWLRTRPPGVAVRTIDQVMFGDPLVANPSLDIIEAGTSPPRPRCFKRIGQGSNFPAMNAAAAVHGGSNAETLRVTSRVTAPIIEIDPTGRGCPIPVVPGRRYEGRAFARRAPSSAAASSASVMISMQVDGVWQPAVVGPALGLDDDWTQVSHVATAPVGATAMIFGVQHAGGADFIVDDLSLIER